MPLPAIFGAAKILMWLVNFRSVITKGAGAVLEAAIKNPKTTLAIVVLAVASWFFYNWSFDRGAASREPLIKSLQEKVTQYEADIEERNQKIADLEAQSKDEADGNVGLIVDLDSKLNNLQVEYAKLTKDRDYWKNRKPGREVTEATLADNSKVEVRVENGKVVCNQYYQEYADNVNKMVDDTNQTIKKARAGK